MRKDATGSLGPVDAELANIAKMLLASRTDDPPLYAGITVDDLWANNSSGGLDTPPIRKESPRRASRSATRRTRQAPSPESSATPAQPVDTHYKVLVPIPGIGAEVGDFVSLARDSAFPLVLHRPLGTVAETILVENIGKLSYLGGPHPLVVPERAGITRGHLTLIQGGAT